MTKIDFTKRVISSIVGTSVSFTVGRTLANNVHPENIVQKGELVIGAAVVGAMVSEKSRAWTDAKVDAIVSWYQTNVTK